MSKITKKPFLGIIVAANTRAEAEREFVSVATGNDVTAMSDEKGTFEFLTTKDSVGMMNPRTGEMDLAESSVSGDLEFVSSSSDELNAEYTVCADGCGSHIIAEAADVVKFCPRCSSELRSLSDEEIEQHGSESFDDAELEAEVGGIVVASDTLESALQQYVELSTSKAEGKFIRTAGDAVFMTSQSSEIKFNPFDGDESLSVAEAPEDFETVSSEDGDMGAHYYLCANSKCDARHVVSTSEDVIICPSCSGGLIEPEAYEGDALRVTVSMDDEDCEDDEEYDDEEDMEDDEMEDEEMEDEDESDSAGCGKKKKSTSGDCEDDEEDEDEDSEEEDEDSDEEESEEDDEEEEDQDISMSNDASAGQAPVVPATTETAAAAPAAAVVAPVAAEAAPAAEPVDMETLKINAVEIAQASSALDAKNLHVCFAGSIKGLPTWLALCNGVHIASATPVTAEAHAELFQSKNYGEVVVATAKEHGVEFALQQLGFTAVSHELNVPALVNRQIEREVGEQVMTVQASAQEELDSMNERFEAALSTAFVGINKRVWKGKTNPVKEALISSLSAAGVRNAEMLVDKCYEANDESYIKEALSKANELMKFTPAAQDEVSQMVRDTSYRSASSSVADRLSSIASEVSDTDDQDERVTVQQPARKSLSSESGELNMAQILSTLGKGKRR